MTEVNKLKESAKADMTNNQGEIGFSEGVIDTKLVAVIAKKVGSNKPGRVDHIRYTVVEK